MSKQLSIYLQDHLAGALFAIDLLERLRDSYPNEPLGRFAEEMRSQIEDDRSKLQALSDQIGDGQDSLKEVTAWLAQKATRLKLRFGFDAKLAEFESLEFLSLGILGKLALWRALQEIADSEPRVKQLDLARLAERAEKQHAEVEAYRLHAARIALLSQ